MICFGVPREKVSLRGGGGRRDTGVLSWSQAADLECWPRGLLTSLCYCSSWWAETAPVAWCVNTPLSTASSWCSARSICSSTCESGGRAPPEPLSSHGRQSRIPSSGQARPRKMWAATEELHQSGMCPSKRRIWKPAWMRHHMLYRSWTEGADWATSLGQLGNIWPRILSFKGTFALVQGSPGRCLLPV